MYTYNLLNMQAMLNWKVAEINPLDVKGSHIWDLAIVSQFWLTIAS